MSPEMKKVFALADMKGLPAQIEFTAGQANAIDWLMEELKTSSEMVIIQDREIAEAKRATRQLFGIEILESETVADAVRKIKDKIDGKLVEKTRHDAGKGPSGPRPRRNSEY